MPCFPIVVTDLDASLLDHLDYSFSAAEPALMRLRELGIPLVLNSSKTMAELLAIRQQLQTNEPFVVENGAGLFVPEGNNLREYSVGMNRAELLPIIHELRKQHDFKFTGFADMSPSQVVEHTGLSLAEAKRAQQRQFSEAIHWADSDEQLAYFGSLLQPHKLSLVRGGRFWHVSAMADKGSFISDLRHYYQKKFTAEVTVIALGDSENDLPMLAQADYPVLIKSPVKPFPAFEHPALRKTKDCGPSGWNQAVLQVLQELNATKQLTSEKGS
jgi:mannosyl-3-phosphoglycerate phosphatase